MTKRKRCGLPLLHLLLIEAITLFETLIDTCVLCHESLVKCLSFRFWHRSGHDKEDRIRTSTRSSSRRRRRHWKKTVADMSASTSWHQSSTQQRGGGGGDDDGGGGTTKRSKAQAAVQQDFIDSLKIPSSKSILPSPTHSFLFRQIKGVERLNKTFEIRIIRRRKPAVVEMIWRILQHQRGSYQISKN